MRDRVYPTNQAEIGSETRIYWNQLGDCRSATGPD